MTSYNVEDLGKLLQAEYDYSYKTNNGRIITIEVGEEFILIKKSNSDWWQVIKQGKKHLLFGAFFRFLWCMKCKHCALVYTHAQQVHSLLQVVIISLSHKVEVTLNLTFVIYHSSPNPVGPL